MIKATTNKGIVSLTLGGTKQELVYEFDSLLVKFKQLSSQDEAFDQIIKGMCYTYLSAETPEDFEEARMEFLNTISE